MRFRAGLFLSALLVAGCIDPMNPDTVSLGGGIRIQVAEVRSQRPATAGGFLGIDQVGDPTISLTATTLGGPWCATWPWEVKHDGARVTVVIGEATPYPVCSASEQHIQ